MPFLRQQPQRRPALFRLSLHGGKTFAQLRKEGYDKELLDKISSLIGKSAFKIHQIPPILNISSAPVVYKEKCLLK